MATDDQLTRGTVNEALSRGSDLARANLLSAGFQPIDGKSTSILTGPGHYNGGLYGRRVSRIEKGDLLFRFSDSGKQTLESKFFGNWWFDRECLVTIRRAGRLENSDFTDAARSYLGVLYEWGDMKNLVGGLLTEDFWCLKGLTGAVAGKRQKMSGPMRTDVMQIYVPGGLRLTNFRQPHDNVLTSGIV
jgi:hypothetical protein